MATLYCDFENGNDNYAGSSFALLAQGTNGRITSTTFSSIGANFPDDGSLIGQYLSIFNGSIYAVYNITAWVSSTSLTIDEISGGTALANQAVNRQYYIGGRWKNLTTGATAVRTLPGDTIRIMGSPAPISLGQNGAWTSQALQAAKNSAAVSATTPIQITCTAHGYSTGDTVVVTGVPGNTNANGTWEITVTGDNTFTLDGSTGGTGQSGSVSNAVRLRNNTRVMLTTEVTQNIASTGPGRAAWTASANCSHTFNTIFFKEHANSDAITVNTVFTTGKAAYYTLPATINLSSYQQVSFWVYLLGDSLQTNEAELRLCSDTTGDTVVDTVPIPFTPGGRLRAVTWDNGSALGSSIASISLFINTDLSTTGNVGLMFSNIIACKASSAPDSLTLTSLIGKNTPGETFWGIQSINGRRVMLDADTNAPPVSSTTVRGYYGTSETVTTWKREAIELGPATSASTVLQATQESGTKGSPITYSGGWDRTDMSTQNLETWLDGVNGNGLAISYQSRSWVTLLKLAFTRFTQALDHGSGDNNISSVVAANNCTSGPFIGVISQGSSPVSIFNVDFIVASSSSAIRLTQNECTLNLGYGILSCETGLASNSNAGVFLLKPMYVTDPLIANCSEGINATNGIKANNIRLESNSSRDVSITAQNAQLINCLPGSATGVTVGTWGSGQLFSQNHDQTADNHKIFMDGGLISSATDQRHTPSGISWKMQPTLATTRSSIRPMVLSLAKVAVSANNLVTIKAWMRRDNSGLTMQLVCKGGQIAGVTNDVGSSLSTTNAWEELTITFTPTEVGVVEITAEAWGGTTFSGWVDDLTISQA